jgi:hypothetical protein
MGLEVAGHKKESFGWVQVLMEKRSLWQGWGAAVISEKVSFIENES